MLMDPGPQATSGTPPNPLRLHDWFETGKGD